MPIFHPNSLAKSDLEEKQQVFQAQDLQTLEKCALALELVGRLRKEGLDFIFKGGTSLMLLFDAPRRPSTSRCITNLSCRRHGHRAFRST